MIKLSVIISSYNRKKYLEELLKSLVNQILDDEIEIIVVDDNSEIDVIDILKKYSEKYKFINIVLKDINQGLLSSRLSGLEIAKGKYIRFFDDDDMCPEGSLYRTIDLMMKYNNKVIRFNHNMIKNGYLQDGWLYKNEKSFFNNKELFIKKCSVGGIVLNIIETNFAKRCFEGIKGIEINQMEDDLLNSLLIKKVKNISFIQEKLYTVRVSETSMSNLPWSEKDFKNAIKVLSLIYENSSKEYLYLYIKHKLNGLIDAKLRVINKTDPISIKTFELFFNIIKEIIEKSNLKINSVLTQYSKCFFLNNHKDAYYKIFTLYAEEEPLPSILDIDNADIISFDIFDTLVERPTISPLDIYKMLNIKANDILGYHVYDFAKLRVNCENRIRTLRKQKSEGLEEDVTLEEIYQEVSQELNIGEKVKKQLYDLEIEIEFRLCKARKIGKKLYDVALDKGKKIIFVSDMYLEKEHIEKILKNCGYTVWNELYVSSDIRKLKSSGRLIEHVGNIQDSKKTIYHIGDNLLSDITLTRAHGWKAGYTPKSIELLKKNYSYSDILSETKDTSIGTHTIFGLIANRLYSNPYQVKDLESLFNGKVSNIGYCAIGPFLFSIILTMLRSKNKHVVFVSRDGYMPKKAMEYVCEYFGIEKNITYLHASRLSYLPIFMENGVEISSLENRYIDNNYIVDDFFKFHLLLTEEEIIKIPLNKYNLSLKDKVNNKIGYIKKLLEDNNYLLDKVLIGRKNVIKYIRQEIPSNEGGITVFDSGNQGSIQKCVEIATGFENIDGYYINTNNGICDRFYLNTFNVDNYFDNYTTSTCPLNREMIETFLSSTNGSCIGYENKNGKMKALEGVSEHSEESRNTIISVQDGIMEFIEDICTIYDKKTLFKTYFNKEHMSSIFRKYSESTNINDKKLISNIYLNDIFSSVRKKTINHKDLSNQLKVEENSKNDYKSKEQIEIEVINKYKNKEYKDALDILLKYYSMNTSNARIHRILAEIYIRLNQKYAALNHLQLAMKIIPNNKNLKKRYFYIKYGKGLFLKNNPFI